MEYGYSSPVYVHHSISALHGIAKHIQHCDIALHVESLLVILIDWIKAQARVIRYRVELIDSVVVLRCVMVIGGHDCELKMWLMRVNSLSGGGPINPCQLAHGKRVVVPNADVIFAILQI